MQVTNRNIRVRVEGRRGFPAGLDSPFFSLQQWSLEMTCKIRQPIKNLKLSKTVFWKPFFSASSFVKCVLVFPG